MTSIAGTLIRFGLCAMVGLASIPALAQGIHQAVQKGDLAAVRTLVEKDPSLVGTKNAAGQTLLHLAASVGGADIVGYLIEKGAAVDASDNSGRTPLHVASWQGNDAAARMLIAKGAAVDAMTRELETPLNLAAEQGHPEVVKTLIANGAKIENRNQWGRTPLVGAARERGGVAVIRVLLDAGARIDAGDRWNDTALSLAAWRGFGDVVDLLLDRGAPIPADEARRRQLLGFSVSKGLNRLFTRMIDAKTGLRGPFEGGGTLLHLAASGGSVQILRTLIEKGLEPNAKDKDGWTPLHEAAALDRAEAVVLLLGKGAEVDARTLMGQTAWNIAEESESKEVSAALAARGADRSPPQFPVLAGEYLGQKKPGASPEIFARGIVSGHYGLHSNVVFSPDGKEAFWSIMIPPRGSGYGLSKTMVSRLVDGRWSYPVQAVFGSVPLDDVPIFLNDGGKLYDMSDRATGGGTPTGKENVWVWQRREGGWADPKPLDATINRFQMHWQFGVDRDQNLYVPLNIPGSRGESDIYVSRCVDGRYQEPENLGDAVNTSGNEGFPFIAPDGSYLLFGRDFDLYVSYREAGGRWGAARALGPQINTPAMEVLPTVSSDGKYLFFSRDQMIYWVDSKVIEDMRPPATQAGGSTAG